MLLGELLAAGEVAVRCRCYGGVPGEALSHASGLHDAVRAAHASRGLLVAATHVGGWGGIREGWGSGH